MWPMNGSHMIDRLTYFLESDVVAVKGWVGNPVHTLSTDTGIGLLQFRSGVYASLVHVGYRDGVNRFQAEITGTAGQIRVDGDNGGGRCIWQSRDGGWEEVAVMPREPTIETGMSHEVFEAQMREFAAAIREARPPAITGEYGRQIVRVLNACIESGRAGHEIRLD
jgi:predicted dehydrogenase